MDRQMVKTIPKPDFNSNGGGNVLENYKAPDTGTFSHGK